MKHKPLMHLGHIAHVHRRTAHEMMEKQGITWGQPPVLRYLEEHDGCIQRDLAENCHVKAASMSSVLSIMEQNGLIERRTVPGDRRALHIFLTEKGRNMQHMVHGVFAELDRRCLEGLSPEEVAVLEGALAKITENLRRISGEQEDRQQEI